MAQHHPCEVTEQYTSYLISTDIAGKTYSIKAKISKGKITLKPKKNQWDDDNFEFLKSTPSKVLAVSRMMKAVVSLHDKKYDEKSKLKKLLKQKW